METTRLLLIEDDPAERAAVLALLATSRTTAYAVTSAEVLDEALELLEADSVEVALLDLQIRDSRGLEALEELLGRASWLPVVVLTDAEGRDLGPRAIQAGAEDFLVRGRLSLESIETAIAYAVARKRHESSLLQAEQYAAVGLLAAGIAHQFNNIDTTITGFAELLLDREDLDTAVRAQIEHILAAARRGTALSRRLVKVATPADGTTRPASLVAIVEEVLELIDVMVESHGIRLTRELGPVPEMLLDRLGIGLALTNIAVNAVHAMVASEQRQLIVRTGTREGHAFVEVVDSGTGIDPADQPRVFCPFFTRKGEFAAGSPQSALRGPGLGLSTAYNTVRLHGGRISVESAPGRGATFRVLLPLPA